MASIYYAKRAAVSCSSTDAQSGYPASNAALESISRPWWAVDAGAKDWIVNFSAAASVQALLLQDVNFTSASVYKSPDGSTFNLVGTITNAADTITGRYRGLIVINDSNVKAVKVSIGSGTPADGLSYWRIGAVYPFASVSAVPRMPDFGVKVNATFPNVSTQLANKQTPFAVTGPDIIELTMPYERAYNQDVFEMLRRSRAATIGLALQPTNYPELVLPVRSYLDSLAETMGFLNLTQSELTLREVV